MVDLSLLQSVSYIAGALGVCVAAFYYVMNLRITQRNQDLTLKALEQSAQAQQQTLETRQATLFMQLVDTYIGKGYRATALEMLSDKWSWRDYDDFIDKYGPDTNPEAWNKFQLQLAHWSQQGILIQDGLLTAEKLNSWWGWVPRELWEKFESIIIEYRGRVEPPPKGFLHGNFEDLYYSLKEIKVKSTGGDELLRRRADRRGALGLKPIPPFR